MMKKSKSFTLLEIMIGIALLAIASGALFWRIQAMVERNRFDSDVNRFRTTLVLTRSMAINTKMDYRLELKKSSEGWNGRVVCREDPDFSYPLQRFSPLNIALNNTPLQEFFVDFYSSGFVGPKGLVSLSKAKERREFKFPELFYRQEDLPVSPLHPSELK